MEILQVVARPPSAGFLRQDFLTCAALAALMNGGEVVEEKAGSVKQRNQRTVMVGGKRVNARFDIREVLPKKRGHVCVDLIAIRDRQIGTGATSRILAFLAPRGLGEPAQGKTMPDIPGDARQLTGTVSHAGDKAGKRCSHASAQLDQVTYTFMVAPSS